LASKMVRDLMISPAVLPVTVFGNEI
jgi:hypothetical protein